MGRDSLSVRNFVTELAVAVNMRRYGASTDISAVTVSHSESFHELWAYEANVTVA